MGTRCYIGKEEANGVVRFVYCHDGENAQRMANLLNRHHPREHDVNALLNAGGITSLKTHPDRQSGENARYAPSRSAFLLEAKGLRQMFPVQWTYLWTRRDGWTLFWPDERVLRVREAVRNGGGPFDDEVFIDRDTAQLHNRPYYAVTLDGCNCECDGENPQCEMPYLPPSRCLPCVMSCPGVKVHGPPPSVVEDCLARN